MTAHATAHSDCGAQATRHSPCARGGEHCHGIAACVHASSGRRHPPNTHALGRRERAPHAAGACCVARSARSQRGARWRGPARPPPDASCASPLCDLEGRGSARVSVLVGAAESRAGTCGRRSTGGGAASDKRAVCVRAIGVVDFRSGALARRVGARFDSSSARRPWTSAAAAPSSRAPRPAHPLVLFPHTPTQQFVNRSILRARR